MGVLQRKAVFPGVDARMDLWGEYPKVPTGATRRAYSLPLSVFGEGFSPCPGPCLGPHPSSWPRPYPAF